jgi:Tol biopolymer transport system component
MDVFVRDRLLGTTERVSLGAAGVEGDGDSRTPSISADGRFVAFTSAASNLVPGDANGTDDVFVRDRLLGTTERVSVDSSGVEGDGASQKFPTISADGRYVVFASRATNLVAGDTNAAPDVFLRDRLSGTTERISVAWNGAEGNGPCDAHAAITADGRFVAFASFASNLVFPDGWGHADVFVRDRQVGTTYRASLGHLGNEPNAGCFVPSISDDGRYVAFETAATNMNWNERNLAPDIFLRDRLGQTTERVSVGWLGAGGIPPCSTRSLLTPDARYLAFASSADTLVVDDSNGKRDVFVRDLQGGTSFTLLCEPGRAARPPARARILRPPEVAVATTRRRGVERRSRPPGPRCSRATSSSSRRTTFPRTRRACSCRGRRSSEAACPTDAASAARTGA